MNMKCRVLQENMSNGSQCVVKSSFFVLIILLNINTMFALKICMLRLLQMKLPIFLIIIGAC